ncbi:MAG: C_GCAxxG_C_C family protein [Deltaproteobacteria bacterium]|nr:C_GCAxxG_C_C family protein [Deltaproteobacteria bacterium]
MRTLRELQGADSGPMVKLVSAMGGGIGMLRNECGAATSPILFLGLLYGQETGHDTVPKVITLGQKYLNRFKDIRGGVRCREVTPTFQHVCPCLQVMRRAPGILIDVVREDQKHRAPESPASTARGHAELLQLFHEQKFHCAHNVLLKLQDSAEVNDEHLRATWGLIGGTVLQGMTCSALTAGVLAIGLRYGGFESSYMRTPRLLFRIAAGLEFMQDKYNAFNKSMNIANSLGLWFKNTYKATECKDLLALDLSTPEGVARYISENTVERCRGICAGVAAQVKEMLKQLR